MQALFAAAFERLLIHNNYSPQMIDTNIYKITVEKYCK